jgi:hypothetical protein
MLSAVALRCDENNERLSFEAFDVTTCVVHRHDGRSGPADQRYWAHSSHVWQVLQHDARSILD